MTECTDSGFFPPPLFPAPVLIGTDPLQTVVVAAPLLAHMFLWLSWEFFVRMEPKGRTIVNVSGLLAGVGIAVQILILQRCFQVIRCLNVIFELDRWLIGTVTLIGCINSIAVGAVAPRAPRIAAAILTAVGGGFAAAEWAFRSDLFLEVTEEIEPVLREGIAPAIAAQLLSYAMATAVLFRVTGPMRLFGRLRLPRPARTAPKGAVQLQADPLATRRGNPLDTTKPPPPPVYCGF